MRLNDTDILYYTNYGIMLYSLCNQETINLDFILTYEILLIFHPHNTAPNNYIFANIKICLLSVMHVPCLLFSWSLIWLYLLVPNKESLAKRLHVKYIACRYFLKTNLYAVKCKVYMICVVFALRTGLHFPFFKKRQKLVML